MSQSNNSEKKIIQCLAKQKSYDLFHNPLNTIIHTAFIIHSYRFEVSLKEKITLRENDVALFYYDYDSISSNEQFQLIKCKCPVFTQTDTKLIFEPAALDLSRNYVVEILDERSAVFLDPSIGGILDTFFYNPLISDLGVTLNGNTAIFKVWSPPSGKIILKLFDSTQQLIETSGDLTMKRGEKGFWAIELVLSDLKNAATLNGLFYQYEIYAYGEKRLALDPYAKSMAAFNPFAEDVAGKGAIVNIPDFLSKLNLQNTYKNSSFTANEIDLIVYETHVRDFTIQPNITQPEISGTFKGFIEKIGYLKELGITHVQFLPVQNFYSVDETDRSFKDTDSLHSNYNWGYDPHNYFTPEGIFSTDPSNPYTRVHEFYELIQALHNNGIGVIMDVVYNHTYINEIFENIAPGCYYRYNPELKISNTTGAGPTLESRRKMVKKLIVDSLKHFVECYKVDGFRFDLMSFLDHETIELIRKEVGFAYNPENINELILQGEGWIFSDIDIAKDAKGQNAAITKINYPETIINLGIFNDSTRDSYAGREMNHGYIHGIGNEADRVAAGITGGLKNYNPGTIQINTDRFRNAYISFAHNPENCLNYLTIHDGFTLWDKINLSIQDKSKLFRARLMRMANAMLFTSQGKIIMHGGDEMLRTKPLAKFDKEKNRAHTSDFVTEEDGIKSFHENSYCSNDFTNMFRWDRRTNEYSEICNAMICYYKGLTEMRRNIPAFRYKNSASIKKGLQFISNTENSNSNLLIAFTLDNSLENDLASGFSGTNYSKLIIVYNTDNSAVTVKIDIIDNPLRWCVILDDHNAGIKPLSYVQEETNEAGKTNILIEKGKLVIPAKSIGVIAQ